MLFFKCHLHKLTGLVFVTAAFSAPLYPDQVFYVRAAQWAEPGQGVTSRIANQP